jgi:signal transduction histidine kinase
MTPRANRIPRILQITVMVLVMVCTVQVGWWIYDEHRYAVEKVTQLQSAYAQQAAAARALLSAGVPVERVRALLPAVQLTPDGARVSPVAEHRLLAQEHLRIVQYAWEGGFFLLALAACLVVIARALRAEALAMIEQDNFLAMVSHQFKTPLASLQLSLETLTMRKLTIEQTRSLTNRMLADLARMENMVSRILESARLDRGRVELRREPVDLAGAVRRATASIEERAAQAHIALRIEIDPELEILADPLALDVILRNVLDNALAAVAPLGGGTIVFSGRRTDGNIELAVRDSGVGFRPADASRLFEKFRRLQPGGGSYHGTGLGLYIVRRLMHLMDGRVTAESAGVGHGARFVLVWCDEPQPDRQEPSWTARTGPTTAASPPQAPAKPAPRSDAARADEHSEDGNLS